MGTHLVDLVEHFSGEANFASKRIFNNLLEISHQEKHLKFHFLKVNLQLNYVQTLMSNFKL